MQPDHAEILNELSISMNNKDLVQCDQQNYLPLTFFKKISKILIFYVFNLISRL